MDGAVNNNSGGNAGLDLFSFLTPPGKEGAGFDNLATDLKGNVIGGNTGAIGDNKASKDFAKHMGFSDKDTIGSSPSLDAIFQNGQQLNISIAINVPPDVAVQLYLNNINPTTPTLPPIPGLLAISSSQLEKGSLAGFQLFVADMNLDAASKKHKDNTASVDDKSGKNSQKTDNVANAGKDTSSSGSSTDQDNSGGGSGSGNDSAAFESASTILGKGSTIIGDQQAVRTKTPGAPGPTSGIDTVDVHAKAHTSPAAGTPGSSNTVENDPKTNKPLMFNTQSQNYGSGGDNSGGNNSGNNSRNPSGSFSPIGNADLDNTLNAGNIASNDFTGSISDGIDAASAANASNVTSISFQKTSGGNPWLAGSPFVQFQIAFSELQRILMQNDIVQGRVELQGMKMTVDLARESADAIMAIARQNQMIHIVAAVMAAVSIAVTVVGLVGGGFAGAKGIGQTARGLSREQWSAVGGMGAGLSQMTNSITQAMTDMTIAQKEGVKEMIQAYQTIVKHIMDQAGQAFKNNEDMIDQLLKLKDTIADSIQQSVAAALQ